MENQTINREVEQETLTFVFDIVEAIDFTEVKEALKREYFAFLKRDGQSERDIMRGWKHTFGPDMFITDIDRLISWVGDYYPEDTVNHVLFTEAIKRFKDKQ